MKIADFVSEVRSELKKVTWPTKQETIRLTQVVIVVSLVVSLYLGVLDYGFSQLLRIVLTKTQ